MNTNVKKSSEGFQVSAGIVIVCCFVVAILIFKFIFGNPSNFMNNDPNNHPLPGNLLGTIYKGGMIVPIIQSMLLTVLVLSVERFFAISRAQGGEKFSFKERIILILSGWWGAQLLFPEIRKKVKERRLVNFVRNVKSALNAGNIQEAKNLCEKQQGSVANVVIAALTKYEQMTENTVLDKEQKELAIQKELEEATALELPTLEQNLPVIATMTTLGTLMGLLGTVIGMIKSFAALANAGTTDSIALSTGISEALVNTAFGIATGAAAVISYNYFTSKIDGITHAIDEVGFSIVQTFAATQK